MRRPTRPGGGTRLVQLSLCGQILFSFLLLRSMWSFLAELTRHRDGPCTLIVLDDEFREQPRQFQVQPRRLLAVWGGTALLVALVLVILLVITPLRELIPGYGTASLRSEARLAAVRLAALEDSLTVQHQYMLQLRHLLSGQVAENEEGDSVAADQWPPMPGALAGIAAEPITDDWADHEQPAFPAARVPAGGAAPVQPPPVGGQYLASLHLPALPPVSGLLTRGFDARTGHFAVDIAVEEGTMVRAIGDGYVIFADWTHEGGYAVTVQHADGYVSVYKHNQRLLKRVGDRVRAREAIAVSGNSGEFTTGPHLHFELWDNGLAQDPRIYLVGL